MTLSERVAVITGATGGLGRVAAAELGRAGVRLALVSTNQSKLDALASELGLDRNRIVTHAADLRRPEAVGQALQAALAKFGRVDILLHLVGGWAGGKTLAESDPQELDDMLAQHATTTHHLIRAFAPHFQANRWGRVIVISSPVAGQPAAKSAIYAAAKAAEEALVIGLAQEVKGSGVTANVLRVRAIDVEHQRLKQPSKENASWTTPEEITAAILYLCCDEAGMVNGARIPMNGNPG
jgi:NAD(P)-dependent dehydrogenase (short-subunit alcohol dehydrogenase family)